MTPAPPRRIFFAGPMNSHAHCLRRKSVIRSVSSVHAADRAFPPRPALRTVPACAPVSAYSHPPVPTLPRLDHPLRRGSLSHFGALSRFSFAPTLRLTPVSSVRAAFSLVCMLNPAPGAGKLRIFSRRKSRRARAFFRFLPLSSRYGNKFHIFPPRFDVKNRAAIVQL